MKSGGLEANFQKGRKMEKYYNFSVGAAGDGKINLASGEMTFICPITTLVQQVYQTGKGWKLNLNQSLEKKVNDPDDRRYIYTDGYGAKHELQEKYFYRKNGKKVFTLPGTDSAIKRSNIQVSQNSRLWLIAAPEIEVFSETESSDNLKLVVNFDGFSGGEKVETRPEELVKVDDEIEALSDTLSELEFNLKQFENHFGKSVRELRNLERKLRDTSLALEVANVKEASDLLAMQKGIFAQREVLRSRLLDMRNTHLTMIKRIGIGNWDDNSVQFSLGVRTGFGHTNSDARMAQKLLAEARFSGRSQKIDMAQAFYQQRFDEAHNRQSQLIRSLESRTEHSSLINQTNSLRERSTFLEDQSALNSKSDAHFDCESEVLDERYRELQEINEIQLGKVRIRLAQASWLRETLVTHLPVSQVISTDGTFGFNEVGCLVSISDNNKCQLSIVFEDKRIATVVDSEGHEVILEYKDGKVSWIKDFQERVTKFAYKAGMLTQVTHPDGEVSMLSYDASTRLVDILPPSKIGKRLIYDGNKVIQISNLTKIKQINRDGVKPGAIKAESIAEFSYDENKTSVKNSKTDERVTYFFNSDNELLHQHIQGEFEQFFVTTYESSTRKAVINEKLNIGSNIAFIAPNHLDWAKNISDLPIHLENLTWAISDLDQDGNPTKTRYSDRLSTSLPRIRQSFEQVFTYKHFQDNRKPLLVKIESTIKTTNQTDRNTSVEYHYNKNRELIRTLTMPDGIIEEVEFDEDGRYLQTVSYHRANPDVRFSLAAITEPNINIGFDFANGLINSLSATVDGERNGTTYTYATDFLTKLQSDRTAFEYTYDHQGRKTAVSDYVKYTYSTDIRDHGNGMGAIECDVVTASYANGDKYLGFTDKHGRLISVHHICRNGINQTTSLNHYGLEVDKFCFGRLVKSIDNKTGETTEFEYDRHGNIIKEKSQSLSLIKHLNVDSNIEALEYQIDKRKQKYVFEYDAKELMQINLPTKKVLEIKRDDLKRISRTEIAGIASDETTYTQTEDGTTHLVALHTQNGKRTRYVYDENSNITEIRDEFNKPIAEYEYDELNRLVKHGETEIGYDTNGNILFKGDIAYQYDCDRLIRFGDEEFEYDAMGNPTKYRDHLLKWNYVRNLESFGNVGFKYNATGLRTHKNQIRYTWSNERLISEHADGTTIDYIYGANGTIGFTINGTKHFYYLKNIQGSITSIVDSTGKTVACYEYDAWGVHKVLNPDATENTNPGFIGNINPISYKGYYWDSETCLYYNMTRYYDPEVGRFLNMDVLGILDITKDFVNGLNLYAYCGNNPVNRVDEGGTLWSWISTRVIQPIGAVIGGTVGAIGGGIGTIVTGGNIFSNINQGWHDGFRGGSNVVESTFVTGQTWVNIWNDATAVSGRIWDGFVRPTFVTGQTWVNIWNNARDFAVSNVWKDIIRPTFVTGETWRNLVGGFWNTSGWLNNNLGNTLDIMSYIGAIGLPMLFTPLSPVGLVLMIMGGVSGIIRIIDNFRPNQHRPPSTLTFRT